MTPHHCRELISPLYNGEIRPEITRGDLSPHTLFAEWFGALGKYKSTNASSRKSGTGGGLLPRCSAELQAGAEAERCRVPALSRSHSPILMARMDIGRVSLRKAFLANGLESGP